MAPRRNARAERSRSASPTESEEEREPFDYKRPKPAVLQSAGLCVWENAAVFCEPRDVAQMELVCRDVNDRLREQSTGTRLLQRYWNLQWAVMVWCEAEISADKRQLLPTSLTRTEGKKNWKKMFVVEYPDWVQRTFQGKGISNNANNAAKTLFHREELNTKRSAAQLAKMELTVDEAIQKAEKKRGVVVEMDDGTTMASDDGSGPSSPLNGKRGPNGRRNEDGNRKPLIRIPKKVVTENFSRQDYQDDKRQGDRKGKHAKGGEKRWSSFGGGKTTTTSATFGDHGCGDGSFAKPNFCFDCGDGLARQ